MRNGQHGSDAEGDKRHRYQQSRQFAVGTSNMSHAVPIVSRQRLTIIQAEAVSILIAPPASPLEKR
jgi:hypothetical protein